MAPTLTWTDERIYAGLERFFKENGRYPSAREFDSCAYLPTARQIQRRFSGGIPEFRKKFNIPGQDNLTTGAIRSVVAKETIGRSYKYEEDFFRYLTKLFPEYLVHEQKRLRPGNISCDFFVYTSKIEGIAIDLFYAMDVWSLARIVNIKLKRYELLPKTQIIYFVCISNPTIEQKEVEKMMGNRKSKIFGNIRVVTELEFKKDISQILKQDISQRF